MAANRLAATPLSRLAGCGWVEWRVFIPGLAEVSEDACDRAMALFLAALAELQEAVFFSVANRLNLQVDILFFDTTSTFWPTEGADDPLLAEADPRDGDDTAGAVEAAVGTRATAGTIALICPGGDRHGRHPRSHLGAAVDLPWQPR
jgi:hypothetical protein